MYLVRQIPENTDRTESGFTLTKVLLRNFEFEIELQYLVRQIPENTDRTVSGFILTKVLLRNLEFEIELYLVRQIPENTDSVAPLDSWNTVHNNLFVIV